MYHKKDKSMKKNLLILRIYDVLGVLFLAFIVFIVLKKDFIISHDFNIEINDTIQYDALNIQQGIEIVSIGKSTDNFSYVDKHGNAISTKECMDNFKKYGEKCIWGSARDSSNLTYCDSLIIDQSPRIVINDLTATIGFNYKGKAHPSYITTIKVVFFLKFILIVLAVLLIRRFIQLTLKGEILSNKVTRVFKYLFILSVSWVVFEYSSIALILKIMISECNFPTIYGTDGRGMSHTFTNNYNILHLYYYIVLIAVTFFLYLAFKYGQKVKSENDLTV